MEETVVASVPAKPRRRWIKITTRALVVVFVLWPVFVGYMWRIMHRSPEAFARVMMHLPWEVFLICPFETMWTHARGQGRGGRLGPGFHADETRQEWKHSFSGTEPEPAGRTGFR